MNVIKPSQEEKERAIQYILSEGLSKPPNLWKQLYHLYRALGFKYLFSDSAQVVGMAVVLMIGFIALLPMPPDQYRNAVLFAAAPVFFVAAVLLAETVERSSVLYEIKMTCRYTIQQIAAFRVLVFSLMGTVMCTLANLFSRYSASDDFLRPLSISICALFLCSYASMVILRSFNWRWNHFAPLLLWLLIGVLPMWVFRERWELFLSQVPITITALIAVIAFGLFLHEIKKLIHHQTREVAYHVGC